MLVNIAAAPAAAPRVLLLAAQNTELPQLNQLGDESDVSALGRAGGMHVDALVGDVTEDDLATALLSGGYSIFHAALHGNAAGLALTREFLGCEQLGALLQVHGVTLAVLLSCESEQIAQQVAAAGVCCVVGTTTRITDAAAYAFCLKFYRHLVKHGDAGAAYQYASRLLPARLRGQFGFWRTEDCQTTPGGEDPLLRIEARLIRLETLAATCEAELRGMKTELLQDGRQGHQEIAGAMLQLVGLFHGLLGDRHG